MEPVVYDFRINPHGTVAALDRAPRDDAPAVLCAPGPADDRGTAGDAALPPPGRRRPFRQSHAPSTGELVRVFRTMVNHLFPVTRSAARKARRRSGTRRPSGIRRENGFDPVQHEQLREDLQRGRIGLARNRLPVDLDIRDVDDSELITARGPWPARPSLGARRRWRGARSPS